MPKIPLRSQDAVEARPIHVPIHGNGVLRPFQPGRSGNPTGKSGLYLEAQRICREASPAAARKMVELMDSDDERVALMAAERVMERGWGKVKDADPSATDPEAVQRREQMRAEVIKMLQALAVPEPLGVDNAVMLRDEADG